MFCFVWDFCEINTAYPFDHHILQLQFSLCVDAGTATFDENEIYVRLLPHKIEQMAGVDWKVYPPSFQVKLDNAKTSGSHSGKRYARLVLQVPIARKWKNIMHDVIFPLQLINIVAFAIYFMSVNDMIQRLLVVVNLLLTLFAFKWTVGQALPPVPYLTVMDWLC